MGIDVIRINSVLLAALKGMPRIDADFSSRRNAALEKKGRGSMLPGGATQFYIPNLTVWHISRYNFSALK
ncbi:hypothetical protein [Edwardsiella ictaluri]|uniref:hypothetical protein n=1 Tax=Edwardsiella ictaluri TaxID=67780 RepID=UPI00259C99B5|nr:hypothetical protein [Edwardsiella ictaluri]WJH21697.1 hypothetical protein FGU63_12505 [Edwardsiella ictaluri]